MDMFNKIKSVVNDAKEVINTDILLDKVKDLAKNTVNKGKENLDGGTIKEKIAAGILSAVEKVSEEREEYYKKTNNIPTPNDLTLIIQNYSHKNAMISGSATLVPGPWGMAAAIPEIVAVMNYQMRMVYDIAKAHGHTNVEKELIIAVLFGGMGNGATGLLVVHGQKIIAKRVGARALQSIVKVLGGNITQKAIKSMAAKWLPVAGAVAMAAWSKYMTQRIGNQAIEVFSKEIIFDDIPVEIIDTKLIEFEKTNDQISSIQIEKTKIEIMINLMNLDGRADDKEIQYIESFISKSNIDTNDKMVLVEQMGAGKKIVVDYTVFKSLKEESLFLLIDLISLAKVDEDFHIAEQMYIKEIARILNFDENDINELMH